MKDWLYPGAKVVCIKGVSKSAIGGPAPQTNGIYTVRAILTGLPKWDQLLLHEFHNSELFHPDGREVGWDARRFRPLTKRPTDISVFTDLLHDVKRAEPVMLNTPWGKVEA